MVKLYVDLILAGQWTLERVAYPWKAQVEARLKEIEEQGGEQ